MKKTKKLLSISFISLLLALTILASDQRIQMEDKEDEGWLSESEIISVY